MQWRRRTQSYIRDRSHHPRTLLRMEAERRGARVGDTEWEFKVCATIKPCDYNATETIGAVAFDRCNEYMATGGIARKIRVYKLSEILHQLRDPDDEQQVADDDDELGTPQRRRSTSSTKTFDTDRSSVSVICTPSRLSSLQWRPGKRPENVLCSDYDGVVTEWSVERQCPLIERDEHGGRHVWSVDYAKDESDRFISASDDGTARVWHSGMENSACTVNVPRSRPVCCAEFDHCSTNLVALACADSNVYVHDLRRPDLPVWTLAHHTRAASYARFLGADKLVSASIDSRVCVWDLRSSSSSSSSPTSRSTSPSAAPRVVECFSRHHNVRNFVGLSVWRQGKLIACGSETNEAFVYQVGRDHVLLRHDFSNSSSTSFKRGSCSSLSSGLASAVCWMQQEEQASASSCTLAAANSDGVLHILSGNLS